MNKPYIQEPPFSVQVELVQGCNLMCGFCGINGIREKAGNYDFANIETIHATASQMAEAGWTSMIILAMHGEPSLHPRLADCIATLRRYLPKNDITLVSNGSGFNRPGKQKQLVQDVFDAGLTKLALDDYEHSGYIPKLLTALGDDVPFKVLHYPADGLDTSPWRRWPAKKQAIVVLADLQKNAANHVGLAQLSNHCGAAGPLTEKLAGQRCAKVFREFSVRWDGGVACCCQDWRGTVKVGNVNDTSIDRLWNNSVMQALRRKLYHGERDFGACLGCDYRSTRVGLLPDKMGKDSLPRADKKDMTVLAAASAGDSLTQIVLRPWEK
jgi:radical SAM protein with 4Fe4S-binding SPASM domain